MERTTTPPVLDARPEGDGHPAVALAVLVTSFGLAILGLAITVVVRPSWNISQWFFAVDTVDAFVYGAVAWLLLSRLRHPVSWILAVTAVGGGLAAVGAQWTLLVAEHPEVAERELLQLMQGVAWVPGTLALIVVVPWLLRDEPLDVVSRLFVAAGVALIGWTVLTRLTDPYAPPTATRSRRWPSATSRGRTSWCGPPRGRTRCWSSWGSSPRQTSWRRRAHLDDPAARRAMTWLAASVVVLSVAFLPLALPDDIAAELPLALTPLLHLVSQALYPAAILGVVLRRQLWGLDLAVRRTLTWWLLTAGLVVAYIVVVAALGALLPGDDEGFSKVLATALVAAVFQPAHAWVQRGVDALVHGEARRSTAVVRRMGRSLGEAGGVDDLLDGVLSGLVTSLRLGGARIDVAAGASPPRTVAALGSVDPARSVELDLVHRQDRIGTMWVAPRANERVDGHSLETVEELAPVIAATLALAVATDELRGSRARLAEARDEERRSLRRELHDGLGPALAGIGLGLQAARNTIERDPAGTAALLERLAEELDARVEEVRGLARGLLPPALEELGLAPALVELAERQQVTGLDVRVEVAELGAVAPDVGSAIYAIAAEAVRNVQRHSSATSCTIRAAVEGSTLVLEVVDDGIGIAPDAPVGVGTRSMGERAEGLGGVVEIGPASPRGTAVVARVPLTVASGVTVP